MAALGILLGRGEAQPPLEPGAVGGMVRTPEGPVPEAEPAESYQHRDLALTMDGAGRYRLAILSGARGRFWLRASDAGWADSGDLEIPRTTDRLRRDFQLEPGGYHQRHGPPGRHPRTHG